MTYFEMITRNADLFETAIRERQARAIVDDQKRVNHGEVAEVLTLTYWPDGSLLTVGQEFAGAEVA